MEWQKIDLQHMPTKSRAWIEAEGLKLARGCLGAAKSTTSQSDDCARKIRGTIGRLPILCAAVAVDQRRGVTTSIQTAAFEWCKWGRRSAQSTWESRPQPTDPRRGITVAGVFLAGSAGEQSERSAAWRGLVSILNGQN